MRVTHSVIVSRRCAAGVFGGEGEQPVVRRVSVSVSQIFGIIVNCSGAEMRICERAHFFFVCWFRAAVAESVFVQCQERCGE